MLDTNDDLLRAIRKSSMDDDKIMKIIMTISRILANMY
jgi:hypothetical protein